MKRKRSVRAVSLVVLTALVLLLLHACGGGEVKAEVTLLEMREGVVVIEAKESGGSLEDALATLKAKGKLTYETQTGEYGAYLLSLNDREADANKHEFWAIYTTLTEYDGVVYASDAYGIFPYEGKALASANYGLTGLPLLKGEIYALALSSY